MLANVQVLGQAWSTFAILYIKDNEDRHHAAQMEAQAGSQRPCGP
jgi:hypothetical protein